MLSGLDRTCRARRFGREFAFVAASGSAPPPYELVESGTEFSAVRFVHELAREPRNLRELERLANSSLLGRGAVLAGDAATIEFVAHQWVRGDYKLYSEPRSVGPGPSEEPSVVEVAPVYNTIREKSFLSVRLVADATDEPISGVPLIVQFPNRSKKQATTDRGGRIDVDFEGYGPAEVTSSIKGAKLDEALTYVRTAATPSHNAQDLGDAELSGKPVISVIKYKVRIGDTLDAIAKGYGITRDDLALFNFGTTDQKNVDKRLMMDVGCRRNRTSKRVEMSSSDKPGIIYVPKPLRLPGLALNKLHIVRVTKARKTKSFSFSE